MVAYHKGTTKYNGSNLSEGGGDLRDRGGEESTERYQQMGPLT